MKSTPFGQGMQGGILKLFLIYIVVAMIIFTVVVQLSHHFLPPLEGLGKGFIMAIKEDQYEVAYAMCSATFKRKIPPKNFAQYIEGTRFNEAVSSEWHSSEIQGSQGRVLGTITLNNGDTLPIELYAVKEKAGDVKSMGDLGSLPILRSAKIWKIHTIRFAQ